MKVNSVEELDSILARYSKVVVDFSAPAWCVPCQRLAPHFAAANENLPDVTFVEVDVDVVPELAQEWLIMSVPTVLAFKSGRDPQEVKARTALALVREVNGLLS